MVGTAAQQTEAGAAVSFFDRPNVQMEEIPVGPGVPLGIERVSNPGVGIGGAYGAWGQSYDNVTLPQVLADRLGRPLADGERLNLTELGFLHRHLVPSLSDEENLDLELRVGARFLGEAARASGWEPGEVDAVLLGITSPVAGDYTERIASAAGIPDSALKVTIHKACDGSVAGLNLALNPGLPTNLSLPQNLADLLRGKKILVGGIEGLSRVMLRVRDMQALQLFGTGAGILSLIPGRSMKFLVGGAQEVYDTDGLLQVRMAYPHSRQSLIEVFQSAKNSLRVAGLMHEPDEGAGPVVMAGPMGMVKLFVRSGVDAVRNVYQSYRELTSRLDVPGKDLAVAIVHHADYKINQLKDKQLRKEGICLSMPWLLSDFGNVSAASNMIAFLRKLASLSPGDHVLFDGFGAGTFYDVLAVELGG